MYFVIYKELNSYDEEDDDSYEDVVEEVVHDRLVLPLELNDPHHVERAGDEREDRAADGVSSGSGS